MASDKGNSRWVFGVLIALACWGFASWKTDPPETERRAQVVLPQKGKLSTRGGSPTIRRSYERDEDDPDTSNDESNDQPAGHFGTLTLSVCYPATGRCYDVDADLSGTTLERIYFPKGGWVDFDGCDLDDDYSGECDDENGRSWEINGEA